MEFSRQEYWSGQPFPSPGDLPDPGIEPWPLTLWADLLPYEPPGKPGCPSYLPTTEPQFAPVFYPSTLHLCLITSESTGD